MQQRRATAAEWATSDYVLADGELGISKDTGIIKIGDGTTAWSSLDPAFDAYYLPILGTAANSDLLNGISADFFVKEADTDTEESPDSYVQRTATGTVKGATAVSSDELTTLGQQTSAISASASSTITTARQEAPGRTVTAATTVTLADINTMLFVNHASLTAQVVVTLPKNTTTAIPTGSWVDICCMGEGGAKIAAASGVSIQGNVVNVFPGYGIVRMTKIGGDLWLGMTLAKGKRLPFVKARRTGSTGYNNSYVCVPYDDILESYNPDSEWFSIPGTGLPTARRIIINKEGEYRFDVAFNSSATATTYTRLQKMVADNTSVGATLIANQSTFQVCNISVGLRCAAGESYGVAHASTANDLADVSAGGGNPNWFRITRIGD
jgi:hypothetical protein